MSKSIYLVNKQKGQLVSDCVSKLRIKYPNLENEKIGHLGTLDPMASGLMVFLAGDQTKQFLELQKLPKQYMATVVLGIKTDSYDLLGIPEPSDLELAGKTSEGKIKTMLSDFIGDIEQAPPPYSAIMVKGKPLYWWHRQGQQVDIKSRQRHIYNINNISIYQIPVYQINKEIELIQKINGDFRQDKILKQWYILIDFLRNKQISDLTAADFQIRCSSGTYIRSIANDVGSKLKIGAFTLNIERTRIGDLSLEDAEIL